MILLTFGDVLVYTNAKLKRNDKWKNDFVLLK